MFVKDKLAAIAEALSEEIARQLPASHERDEAIRKINDAAEDLRGVTKGQFE